MKIINLERFIKNKTIREWIEALIFALIIAGIFRTWLYAPFRVPTGSMIHTIEIGDHLFADMHAYGYRIPFTDKKLAIEPVNRGDIIIFPNPENPEIDFIKRAIAIGGDTVELRGEEVFINGKPEPDDHVYKIPHIEFKQDGVFLEGQPISRENITLNSKAKVESKLFEGRYRYFIDGEIKNSLVEFKDGQLIIYGQGPKYTDYFCPEYKKSGCHADSIVSINKTFKVPKGKIWAMGDNRRNSRDSRFWGFVDETTVKGKGLILYWSHNPEESLLSGYRFNRIATFLK